MDDLLSQLRNKAEDERVCFEAILKSLRQFSGKLTFVAPSSHKFSIYLLLL